MALWVAAIDDSGNEPNQNAYILAGFVARYERWAEFSTKWQEELDAHPKISAYKFTQARALKGAFTGFTEAVRDERELRLASIAKEHADYFVSAGMRHQHFEKLIQTLPTFERTLVHDHPYIMLLGRLAGILGEVSIFAGGPVDCIADAQGGFEQEAFDWWSKWRDALKHPDTGERLLGDLNFRSEQDFLPLQAADLAAGAIRHYEMTGSNLPALQKISEVRYLDNNYAGEELRSMSIRMLDRVAAIAMSNPDLELQAFNRKTAARLRKYNRRNREQRKTD